MPEDDVLIHYGVKGQKWGVRKKKPVTIKQRARKIVKKYKQGTKKERLKKMASMSTKELNEASNRIDAERRYMNATKPVYAKAGAAIVGGILAVSAKEVAKDYIKAYAKAGLKAAGILKPNSKK